MSVETRLHSAKKSRYNYELINMFIAGIIPGIIVGNIIIPILYLSAIDEYLPPLVEKFFIFYAILVSSIRIIFLKLLKSHNGTDESDKYIYYTVIATGLSGSLWGFMSIGTYIYAPQYLLLVSVIAMGLVSGAMGTMVQLINAYISYTLSIIVPLITVLLLSTQSLTDSVALGLIFYSIFIYSASSKQYKKLREVIKLKDKLKFLNDDLEGEVKIRTVELEELNNSLEYKVAMEIEKNRHKDQQMLEQSRMAQMGEMISMIAHQWRQPLGAISSTSIDMRMKMMLGSYDLSDEKQREECITYSDEKLEKIEGFVQDLTNTIDDFRNFYKPDKKKNIQSINKPIEKSLGIIEGAAKASGVLIEKDLKSELNFPMFNSELMQVFLNIIKNAQDNFKEKNINEAKITINSKDIKDGVEVNICDNGGGICEDIIKKIFDPYFSTKSEKNGTGLGLYMSKTIIQEHHNGKLIVKNTDEGVCFKIVINKTD